MATASKCDCLLPTGLMVSIDLGTVSSLLKHLILLPLHAPCQRLSVHPSNTASRFSELIRAPPPSELPPLTRSLTPNIFGMFVCVQVRTLNELKSELWREAQKLPFFQQLGAANTYGFEYVSRDGDLREVPLEDEAKTKHKDIGWFEPLLKVVKLKGRMPIYY